MKFHKSIALTLALATITAACARKEAAETPENAHEPAYAKIEERADGGYCAISISPFDGSRDTLIVSKPLERLIVMSTSHVGFLSAIKADSAIVGVSGGEYVCEPEVMKKIADGAITDIGYDANPDYEKILDLKPDLVLTYTVSPAKPQFIAKLESLGIKTFTINEHLETHPLARAAYIRLFGALTGKMEIADSVLKTVSGNYMSLRDSIQIKQLAAGKGHHNADRNQEQKEDNPQHGRRKILVNIPYKDQWFIPGQLNYLTNLFCDADGEILGTVPGSSVSGQITVEAAYSLSKQADLWMNVGWCQTLDQLLSVNPLFEDFLMNIQKNSAAAGYSPERVVWNDNRRLNSKGGNDFWESGVVRPDLILRDLIGIFSDDTSHTPVYYKEISGMASPLSAGRTTE